MKLLKAVRMWTLMRLIGESPVAANLTIRGELEAHGHDGLIMNNYIDGTDYQEKQAKGSILPFVLTVINALFIGYLWYKS